MGGGTWNPTSMVGIKFSNDGTGRAECQTPLCVDWGKFHSMVTFQKCRIFGMSAEQELRSSSKGMTSR